MTFDFNFRTVQDTKDLKQLVDFLMKQPLNYQRYEDWVQRAEAEIDLGYKKAILAFSNGHIVGDLVYQPHKELPRTRELKNLRIDPTVRDRYFANFMLRQLECENPGEFDLVMIDVREGREDMINRLLHIGYKLLMTTNLYDQKIQDMIFIKYLNQNNPLLKI